MSFNSGRSIGFGLPYVRVLHFAGCLVVASLGLQWLMAPLHIELSPLETKTFDAIAHDGFGIFVLVVVGPFIEELVFRAGMFSLAPEKNRCNPSHGAFFSAFRHRARGIGAQGIPAFIIGMGLALLYFRSDDLRLCYPAHAANNALAVVGMLCPTVGAWGDNWPAVVQVLLGLLLLVAGFAGLMMRGSLFSKQRNNS